jgi:two-component system, LytTR family, response regulator
MQKGTFGISTVGTTQVFGIKVALVDDNQMSAGNISSLLQNYGFMPVGPASNYLDAISLLVNERPQVVLIDLETKGEKSGFDVADFINDEIKCPIIFLTSDTSSETLASAKRRQPAGYLVKPVQPASLLTTIEIALSNNLLTKKKDILFLQSTEGVISFELPEVCYIKADHVYCHVHSVGKEFIVRSSLTNILTTFLYNSLIRIHKSYIVNVEKISKVGPSWIEIEEHRIPIGKTYQKDFNTFLEKYLVRFRSNNYA